MFFAIAADVVRKIKWENVGVKTREIRKRRTRAPPWKARIIFASFGVVAVSSFASVAF